MHSRRVNFHTLLYDKSIEVRKKALSSLIFLRHISTVEPLLEVLREKDPYVQEEAAEDLAYVCTGSIAAEKKVRYLLKNADDRIREMANRVLEALDEQKEMDAISEEQSER